VGIGCQNRPKNGWLDRIRQECELSEAEQASVHRLLWRWLLHQYQASLVELRVSMPKALHVPIVRQRNADRDAGHGLLVIPRVRIYR
jgi:hypothetical protein